jgi:NAD(P)-dependent dehydrogenase (short-subunit alcohol dehydrogenase family)
MASFANRVVLITGAGNGIGRQFALQLAAEGAVVAALDLSEAALAGLQQELAGKRCAVAVGDVTVRDSLFPAVSKLQQQLGPIDLLIANAGIGRETSALKFKAADFEAQIQVNLIGVANSIEAVLPGMIERRQGHIVGMSSLASFRGLPKMSGYCASKAGLNALLDSVRLETKRHGVRVTTICPGWIRTALTENVGVPKPYMMELDFAVRKMIGAIRCNTEFIAFPTHAAWQVRVLGMLPVGISDALMRLMLRGMTKKRDLL